MIKSPHFLPFLLTDERYRLVWLLANSISEQERNYVLPDGIFTKHGKIMKEAIN